MARNKRIRSDIGPDSISSAEEDGSPELTQSPSVCLLCRQRKQKCDRQLPKCQHCVRAKVDCQYAPKPQKRGLRAGYVSELEQRLGKYYASSRSNDLLKAQSETLEDEVRQLKANGIVAYGTSPLTAPDSVGGVVGPYGAGHGSDNANTSTINTTQSIEPSDQQHELHYLTSTALAGFFEIWFKEYQPWCPIMHRPIVLRALEKQLSNHDDIPDIVLKALVSLTVSHSSQAIAFGYQSRRKTSDRLRSEVLGAAIGVVSLETLQVLLVIAILDYGYDKFPSAWNLLSICKSICERLGLATQRGEGSSNTMPGLEGIAHLPNSNHSQMIYVTWMVYTMDCSITVGARWRSQSLVQLPPLPDNTADSDFSVSASLQAAFELPLTGLELVQGILHKAQNSVELDADTSERSEEAFQVLMSYADKRYNPSYTLQIDGSITFDTNAVLTTIMANASVIILYQRFLMIPSGDIHILSEFELAIQRCQDACDQMINTISNVADIDIEFVSPVLASHFFVAARFHLACMKRRSRPRPARFDLLMHALNMCGRRWPLARRLDIVLRAAIVELDGASGPSVPASFWDLRQSSLDIDDELRQWVKQLSPSIFIGSLNGPYA